jgi:hypothetical protein
MCKQIDDRKECENYVIGPPERDRWRQVIILSLDNDYPDLDYQQ